MSDKPYTITPTAHGQTITQGEPQSETDDSGYGFSILPDGRLEVSGPAGIIAEQSISTAPRWTMSDIREQAARASREWAIKVLHYERIEYADEMKLRNFEAGYLAGYESAKAEAADLIRKAITRLASEEDNDGWGDGMKILFPLAGLGEFSQPEGTPCSIADLIEKHGGSHD